MTRKLIEQLAAVPEVGCDGRPFSISPDGTTVAFHWRQGGDWQIFTVDALGETSPQRLAEIDDPCLCPLYSRDGRLPLLRPRRPRFRELRYLPLRTEERHAREPAARHAQALRLGRFRPFRRRHAAHLLGQPRGGLRGGRHAGRDRSRRRADPRGDLARLQRRLPALVARRHRSWRSTATPTDRTRRCSCCTWPAANCARSAATTPCWRGHQAGRPTASCSPSPGSSTTTTRSASTISRATPSSGSGTATATATARAGRPTGAASSFLSTAMPRRRCGASTSTPRKCVTSAWAAATTTTLWCHPRRHRRVHGLQRPRGPQ